MSTLLRALKSIARISMNDEIEAFLMSFKNGEMVVTNQHRENYLIISQSDGTVRLGLPHGDWTGNPDTVTLFNKIVAQG